MEHINATVQFQLVMSLFSFENLLKCRSLSACKLPEFYSLDATCANRIRFEGRVVATINILTFGRKPREADSETSLQMVD